MPKVDLLNMEGKKVGSIELSENVFGVEVNEYVMHDVVVNYLANQRQGTQSTKTRSEVSGGGKKPWKQKGTGRARQGSIRAPQWIKGGIALGPKPRSYKYTLNKKVKRLALKSALTTKLQENAIIVLDELNFNEIKTKNMANVLSAIKAEKALVVISEKNLNVQLSARNIADCKTATVNTINTYDIIKYPTLVLTKAAVEKIEEVYA
ncbi:MAG: 50S ribosomal protein L4 [Clostridia bacterium]|nr:50S ribosomal protein L4 [Clostridia bacterium]